MNVEDLPKDLYDKIKAAFDANNDVRLLRTAQQDAKNKGDFMKALRIAQDIDNLWTICLNNYMIKAEQEVNTISTGTAGLPQKDKDSMMEKLIVLFMACEIVESAIMDMNDTLHKTKSDVSITSFSDLKQSLELAREKLMYLEKNGDYMNDKYWADRCDDMYSMMKNKARSIIRKRNESKNWGKNVERVSLK